MKNTRVQVLKKIQQAIDQGTTHSLIESSVLEDVYELLTEPYQMEIDDLLDAEGYNIPEYGTSMETDVDYLLDEELLA